MAKSKKSKEQQVENKEYSCPSCGRKSVVEGECERCSSSQK